MSTEFCIAKDPDDKAEKFVRGIPSAFQMEKRC